MKNIILLTTALMAITACSGRPSYTSSAPWKQTDKHLSCDQLLLEMNDAKFWNSAAHKNKGMGIGDVINPIGYMNSRSNANEAIDKTNGRLRHLNEVYRIKGCAKPYADTPIVAPGGGY